MSKRKKRSSRTPSQAQRGLSSDKDQALPSSTATESDPSSSQEYKYVTKDLTRVAILAVALFALLFALSFFIG